MKLKNIKSFCKILSRQCHGYKIPPLDPNDLPPSRSQLVPEISLRLLTPSHELWHKPVFQEDEHFEPFWSIFWPGGQVLTRFILDSKILEGQRVLDLGCGCGAQGMFTTWVNINIFLSQKSRCLEVLSITFKHISKLSSQLETMSPYLRQIKADLFITVIVLLTSMSFGNCN